MGDGTPAFGRRLSKAHGPCVRCGKRSYHMQKKRCAACGYPGKRIRHYNWALKGQRRRNTGTGRMRYLKKVQKGFKNRFRSGTVKPPRSAKGKARAAARS